MSDEEIYAALEKAGHKLVRREDGSVNEWVLDDDNNFHNGPGCELCGQSWCQHCLRRNLSIQKCPKAKIKTKTK
jgi:hypothetical protein